MVLQGNLRDVPLATFCEESDEDECSAEYAENNNNEEIRAPPPLRCDYFPGSGSHNRMRRLTLSLSLSALVLFAACKKESTAPEDKPFVVSHVVWEQTNGPSGGSIRALAVLGTNLFAGTLAGVFKGTMQ